MSKACKVALLGAECTGKSSLTTLLGLRLADLRAATVTEYLREWCVEAGRTPRREEQTLIAAEQARRVSLAAGRHPLVVSDTTPLMTALYSIHYFQDAGALEAAVADQRGYQLTLLCSPSGIPWQADGWMRESPAVRLQAHHALQDLLQSQGLPFTVLSGPLDERAALAEMLIRSLPALRPGRWSGHSVRARD